VNELKINVYTRIQFIFCFFAILQLFARLGHPEEEVRQQVMYLLLKIGEDYPHVVAYPAIVGVLSEATNINPDVSHPSPETARALQFQSTAAFKLLSPQNSTEKFCI
jgi:hypothetical protein